MTDADWEAFVAWWNTGVAAGWGVLSLLNERDGAEMLEGAPAAVLARIAPTRALAWWLEGPGGYTAQGLERAMLERTLTPSEAVQALQEDAPFFTRDDLTYLQVASPYRAVSEEAKRILASGGYGQRRGPASASREVR